MSIEENLRRIGSSFDSVEAGKAALAQAISEKGVATDVNAGFPTLIDNLRSISGGYGFPSAELVAHAVIDTPVTALFDPTQIVPSTTGQSLYPGSLGNYVLEESIPLEQYTVLMFVVNRLRVNYLTENVPSANARGSLLTRTGCAYNTRAVGFQEPESFGESYFASPNSPHYFSSRAPGNYYSYSAPTGFYQVAAYPGITIVNNNNRMDPRVTQITNWGISKISVQVSANNCAEAWSYIDWETTGIHNELHVFRIPNEEAMAMPMVIANRKGNIFADFNIEQALKGGTL